jgi:tetratricopeptide (TPR) repeat protein
LGVALGVACRTTVPAPGGRVPDPLAAPVPGPALDETQRAAIRDALAAAQRKDVATAGRTLDRLPADHPVIRLTRLEVAFLDDRDVSADALALAQKLDTYPAAWELAADAAARRGENEQALQAGRRWATLAPSTAAERAVERLEAKVSADVVADATGLLARGEKARALDRAHAGLELVPDSVQLRSFAVRAALAAGRPREAAALVPSLPDDASGLALKAQVAEALGEWELAVKLYEEMPAETIDRCEGLRRARRQLMLLDAPPYLRAATTARPLRRRDLAALLVWEYPDLAGQSGSAVQVFEDVVQLPEQADILTLARAGIMRGDTLTRRFSPNRVVGQAELRSTLDRLAQRLRLPTPRWCSDGAATGCLEIPSQPDGRGAADLIATLDRRGGNACR